LIGAPYRESVRLADGDNPVTHSFVPVYRTAAEREAFVAKLQADPAWAKFQKDTAGISRGVSTVQYRTLKRWGDISDDDVLWQTHAFAVRDAAAFVAARDGFMAAETGKTFPGQVFLSSVVAGGMTPVTHVVSVGFIGEGEREGWAAKMDGNPDWDKYSEASRKAADYLGNNMVRTVKTRGATLD
jgi:hypothetical protein